MENTLSVILIVLGLLVGALGGTVMFSSEGETEYVDVVEYVNNTVTEYVDAPDMLSLALSEFLSSVEAEEDEAGNYLDVLGNYNFDELEVSKVYKNYYVSYENDVTQVDFEVKLRFKEADAVAEKENYEVSVRFELDEDTEVEAHLLD